VPRTKIIATLGPASSSYTVLRKMVAAGLDAVRLNFSHGSHKQHLANIELVGRVNEKYRRHIRIIQDLEGLRIRVGRFKDGKTRVLKNKTAVWLSSDASKDGPKTVPLDFEGDLTRIGPGQVIYMDDGNIAVRVETSSPDTIKARVIEGGVLKERKGINIPDVDFGLEGITEKDKADIKFGITHKVDYVALSFVRNASDVKQAVGLIKPKLPGCKIVAKIENRQAIKNIDSIITVTDGIMIARGDMGVSIPVYQVPIIQKQIIKKCNAAKKFVITATQMLEHMTEHSRPTRAEVADVANAVIDGTDFVMLSAETAVGRYPAECVRMMNEIIKYTERAAKQMS